MITTRLSSAGLAWLIVTADIHAAGAAPPPIVLPDTGLSVLRVLGALVFVLALFLAGVWCVRHLPNLRLARGATPKLQVLEAKSLGARQAVYVLGYEQQRMLLASSPAGIVFIAHLPDEAAPPGESPKPAGNFTAALLQVLARR